MGGGFLAFPLLVLIFQATSWLGLLIAMGIVAGVIGFVMLIALVIWLLALK